MANQAKTINQKGDLMSYRPDIKLLDATIRDGGLVNNFGEKGRNSPEQVEKC